MGCRHYLFFICQYSLDNQSHYTLVLQQKMWMEAREYCRTNFYSLANLHDATILKAEALQDVPVWIGLRREGKTTPAINTPSRL